MNRAATLYERVCNAWELSEEPTVTCSSNVLHVAFDVLSWACSVLSWFRISHTYGNCDDNKAGSADVDDSSSKKSLFVWVVMTTETFMRTHSAKPWRGIDCYVTNCKESSLMQEVKLDFLCPDFAVFKRSPIIWLVFSCTTHTDAKS